MTTRADSPGIPFPPPLVYVAPLAGAVSVTDGGAFEGGGGPPAVVKLHTGPAADT